ncbi:EMILIN-2 isoform X2 [Anabas testudineus]|uniref:EMILIN-2 isoform X2 n=1 Tax=Anabas testudineus TaxID=64144 RepID=UPI000E4650C4|nr:EMILIN-2 isoform X2 [Anabas testudineus]
MKGLSLVRLLITFPLISGTPFRHSMFQSSAHSGTETRQRNKYRTHFKPMYKIAYKTVTELEWRCCPGYQGHNCMEVKDLKLLQAERPPASGPIPAPHAPEQRTDGQSNHPWGGGGHFGGQAGHGGSQSAQHLEEEVHRLSQMVLDMQARMTDMTSNLRLDFQEDASKMLVTLLNNLRQPASAQGAETQTIQLPDFSFGETTSMDEVMNKISQVNDDLESKGNTLNDLLRQVDHLDGQVHVLMEAAQNPQSTSRPPSPAGDADLRAYVDDKIRALREELMEGMEIKLADLKNSCDYKIMSVQEQCEGQEANYLSLAELMDSKETDLRNEIQDLKTKLVDPGKEETGGSDSILARVEKLEIHVNSSDRTVPAQCFCEEEDKLKKEQAEATEVLRETQKDVKFLKGSVQTLESGLNALDQLYKANLSVVENLQQDLQSCKINVETMESSVKDKINGLRAMEEQLLNYSTNTENIKSELSSMKDKIRRLENSLLDAGNQESQTLQSLNSTWGQVKTGSEQETRNILELHRTQHQELSQRLDELRREVKADADHCREKTEDVGEEIVHMDRRVVNVERLCAKLDPISSSLQRIKEGLNKHVTGLWTCVNQLNGTVNAHSRDIGGLQGTCQNLQNSVTNIARDLQVLTNSSPGTTASGVQVAAEDTGLPQTLSKILTVPGRQVDSFPNQLPVLETGEAGPPGKMTMSKLTGGIDGSMMPVQGFAGAPASPVKSTDSVKTSVPLISGVNMPHRPSPQKPVMAPDEKVAFSAGLTLLPFQGEVGIIRFNKVLVNDGGHYDPHTGIFTAPTEGRYLVTAVLAAQRGERTEAVLSVSNRSIQRLDSAGFLSEAAAPTSRDQCNCSSPSSLSLVLSLKRGDRVGLVMITGKLAISASSEILSSFSAVLLYPNTSKR